MSLTCLSDNLITIFLFLFKALLIPCETSADNPIVETIFG